MFEKKIVNIKLSGDNVLQLYIMYIIHITYYILYILFVSNISATTFVCKFNINTPNYDETLVQLTDKIYIMMYIYIQYDIVPI